jgi:DNA-binding beta-propeller fold protein YncE
LLAACSPAPQWIATVGDGQVTLYDAGLAVIDGFGAPARAGAHIAFDPSGTAVLLLTASPDGTMLVRLSRLTGTVDERWRLPGAPVGFAAAADGTIIVGTVAATTDDSVAGLLHVVPRAAATRRVRTVSACSAPLRDTYYWEDGREVFVVCADGTVVEVDARLWVKVRSQAAVDDTCDPRALTMSANGTLLFVVCGVGRLQYVDRLRLTALDSVEMGFGARGVARTPNGRYALIPIPERDVVAVVDLRRRTVDRRLGIRTPVHVTVSGDGGTAYVVSRTASHGSEILAVDLASLQIVQRVAAVRGAASVAVWPGQRSPTMRWRAAPAERVAGSLP